MKRKVGAVYKEDKSCEFSVWAPLVDKVELIIKKQKSPISMTKDRFGYWITSIEGLEAGSQYKFRLNNKELPDPASRFQPEGVHTWSQVVASDFSWRDQQWKGLDIADMIIYELHVGSFTEKGTFQGVIEKLDYLKELGVNTLEIMPVAQFPGSRNWGYDGVYPFAAQESYGGPEELKKLVDACHSEGIAVLLDVVYNHMGPEGNYLAEYGPYFTDKYKTPWGAALNFDDEYSGGVRNFFLQNVLMWLEEFHFDGLRMDAVHEIIDRGANHFLGELSEEVDALEEKTGRNYVLIAETDLNDSRFVSPREKGGYGLEGHWVDDFHHSLHTLLTEENNGYYSDYGSLEDLAKSLKQAYVYDGRYSEFRKKRVGNSPKGKDPAHFVVCIQNHDQTGNRLLGERLPKLVSFESLKLAASLLLSSRYVPMLFMGEEYGEDSPFMYFVSHTDPELVKAVQEGRKREFSYFFEENSEEFPDPQAEEVFQNSRLKWNWEEDSEKGILLNFYKELIHLRKDGAFDVFRTGKLDVEIDNDEGILQMKAEDSGKEVRGIFNFGENTASLPIGNGEDWQVIIASADKKWGGTENFDNKAGGGKELRIPPKSAIILNK